MLSTFITYQGTHTHIKFTMPLDEVTLQTIREQMLKVKLPGKSDKVYKDECMFCFANSESPGGLFINLTTHQAFDQDHLDLDHQRTGAALYLVERSRRVS